MDVSPKSFASQGNFTKEIEWETWLKMLPTETWLSPLFSKEVANPHLPKATCLSVLLSDYILFFHQ
jgi:hypothetical protein